MPSMHTRSCNHVCGCRVHCRRSERCTSQAVQRSCCKAAWSDQVHAAALHVCAACRSPRALPLLIARVRLRAAGLLPTSAQAARRAARAPEPSRACCSGFLRPRDDVAARAAVGERRGLELRAGRCRHRRAGSAKPTVTWRSTAVYGTCGGTRRRRSRAGWEGRVGGWAGLWQRGTRTTLHCWTSVQTLWCGRGAVRGKAGASTCARTCRRRPRREPRAAMAVQGASHVFCISKHK